MTSFDIGAFERAADALLAPDAAHGSTLALLVMQSGSIVAERYGLRDIFRAATQTRIGYQ